ncbi:TetR/AcrR family transcriptional regulator [Amycolatopsis jejuensis]|uniref:TetR/AcrR family transcriptional regulator n=1 Tax=Amycolatopsis jejuensis TaxID=330084 RepID=UPI00068EF84D|nr:TetR/AcrR family transcriptional regulator [Amycolatopsis jejuensis]
MVEVPPDTRLDRRQRRWLQVHDAIYDAACELFGESGFDETSFGQIAERADVARKTVFNHFPRKRDFVSEWGRRRRAQVLAHLSDELLAQPSLDTVLRHYYTELAKLYETERAFSIRMLLGWRSLGGPFDDDPHRMIGQVGEFIVAAQKRGEVGKDINPGWIATMLYSTYFGLLYDWCKGDVDKPPFNLRKAFLQAVGVVVDGVQVKR